MTKSRGYVYVANGKGYVAEAVRSAKSLRAAQLDANICILTNEPVQDPVFDIVLKPSSAQYLPIDKTCASEAPFDEIVYLDTDTYIASDISEIFDVLQNFDIAVLQALQRGWNYTLPNIPKVFSEFNTGVIAFRNTDKVKAFFREWRAYHEQIQQEPNFPDFNTDQPAFRATLFKSDLRVAPLPSEYHFRGHIPNYLMWDAKIIHCRGDLPKIAKEVNSELGVRVHIPGFGVYSEYRGRLSLLKKMLQSNLASLRYVFHPPYNAEQERPKQWHLRKQHS